MNKSGGSIISQILQGYQFFNKGLFTEVTSLLAYGKMGDGVTISFFIYTDAQNNASTD
jgi:hypothetical protein